jgi:TorA maturation chaperone TorD
MKYQEEAKVFCEAVAELAAHPEALDNLELYLSHHFSEWLTKYAATPEEMAGEMHCFASIRL